MSTITSSTTTTYTTTTSTSSYSSEVSSFLSDASDLIQDQSKLADVGNYDTFSTTTDSEEYDGSIDLSGIYTAAMGNTAGVTYSENGDVESVNTTQLQYNRLDDYQNMLKLMLLEKPVANSYAQLYSDMTGSAESSSSLIYSAALTEDGSYSSETISDSILEMAAEIAGDDLDLLAELQSAAIEAFESAGNSSLSSETYDKVLSGFANLEAEITARLEAAAEEEADVETDTDVDADTDVDTEVE